MKDILSSGVEEVIVKEHLESALRRAHGEGKKLRVKFGIDPTAPDLHLGHTVPLRKLRQFQDAGHTAVLIIGDFTAMIGDPSGREGARQSLTKEQVKKNLKKYLKFAGKIIDIKKADVYYNSKWLNKSETIMKLTGLESVQRVIERDDFQKRFKENKEVMIREILYPLMQGYDSVMVKADVEIGGTDQKFNLLMGRRMQRAHNMPEQDIITLPLLEGTDGARKMSKSYGNYIALDAEPNDMFGKIMRVHDNLIDKYFTLLTEEERKIKDPREAKLELAKIIVSMYHDKKTAEKAKENFIKVFSRHEKPENVPSYKLQAESYKLIDLLVLVKMAVSKGEARRLIIQGGARVNDEKKTDPNEVIKIEGKTLLQVGKRRFLMLTF